MKITISIPHDYNSEADMERAMSDCGVTRDDSELDIDAELHDKLHSPAIDAGLEMLAPTDFGITYEGTKDQIDQCSSKLPSWAYVHVESFDEFEGHEDRAEAAERASIMASER